MTQAGHITVVHGNLTVDVPRRLFRGPDCEIDEEAARPFRDMVRAKRITALHLNLNVMKLPDSKK